MLGLERTRSLFNTKKDNEFKGNRKQNKHFMFQNGSLDCLNWTHILVYSQLVLAIGSGNSEHGGVWVF